MAITFDDLRLNDRENRKFRDAGAPNTKVAVSVEQDANNPIPVNIVDEGFGGDLLNIFSEITSVATNTETEIDSYTVPFGQSFFLRLIDVSGTNMAKYTIELNASKIAVKRTYFTHFNTDFDFKSLELVSGDVLKIKVIHDRSETGDFESRIMGNLV